MFKKYYKQANDDIKTNRELIDKIFDEAAKPATTKTVPKIYKYGISIAAVIAVVVSASVVFNFGGNGTPTIEQNPSVVAVNDKKADSKSDVFSKSPDIKAFDTDGESGDVVSREDEGSTNINVDENVDTAEKNTENAASETIEKNNPSNGNETTGNNARPLQNKGY